MAPQPPSVPVFYPHQAVAPQLNAMADAFRFLLTRHVFRARRTTTGTVTKGGHTLVPWNQIDEDPYSGWSAGSPTRYTVQAPGWYAATGTVSLSGTGATSTVLIPSFAINGGSQIGAGGVGWEGPEVFIPLAAGEPKAVGGYWEGYCNLGDYIELDTFLSSEPAANLTWNTTTGQHTNISVVWMGA